VVFLRPAMDFDKSGGPPASMLTTLVLLSIWSMPFYPPALRPMGRTPFAEEEDGLAFVAGEEDHLLAAVQLGAN